MTFITTPFMRSFVGFDQLFNELENTATIKDITIDRLFLTNVSGILVVHYFDVQYLSKPQLLWTVYTHILC